MADREGEAGAGEDEITLERHAEISAEIAEGDKPLAEILAAHRISEARWNEATVAWMKAIGDDVLVNADKATLPHVYSDAFSRAQDAKKPVVPMDAEAYATLVVDVQIAGGPAEPLNVRGLSTADYLRLSRHWSKVLSSDEKESAAFFDAYDRLQPAPESDP